MSAMLEKICRTCRYPFSFPVTEAVFCCPACDAVNGRPESEGAGFASLTRATQQRLRCDFHNAVISYQHVLLDCPEEHEALWGLALCRYGVEYVEDPRSGTLMPTVHSVRRRPMQADKDYLNACEQAPERVRAQYEAEAAYIDDAMARILELAQTQKPYDVFICHKTTKPDSDDPTWECLRASEMAHQMEKLGYRVFFAPEAMKGEIGADYEAAIYHALDTAKVLLLLCAEPDYVTSPWVRSEWTRFLEMTDEREDKRLVPLLYGDFTPAKLPREIRPYRLECVTMDSFTAAGDILRLLEKCCGGRGKVEEKAETVEEKPAPVQPEPEKPAPVPENPVTEMKTAPVQSVSTYAPETDFETEIVEGGCAITKYMGKDGEVNVPPMIGGRKVVEIGKKAFEDCRSLTSITLPEGVTSIGNSAFYNCDSLANITLPESLTSLGNFAFYNCGSLANITLPESLTSIGAWTFINCVSLANITLPESLTSIGDCAFDNCSTLTSISLPGNLTRMGANPFYDCSKLVDISVSQSNPVLQVVDGVLFDRNEHRLICYPCTRPGARYEVPADVRSIGTMAFKHCNALTHITLPEGLTRIGNMAFEGCSALAGVSMPESLTSIAAAAFNTCRKLTSISLPVGLKDIGEVAFAHCSGLIRVSLPENVTLGRNVFLGCTSLRADNIIRRSASAESATEKQPASATVPAYAPESDFETAPVDGGCSITKYKGQGGHVNVPPTIGGQKVVEIGKSAFEDCRSLTSITLPKGVKSIGNWAFHNCIRLTSITLPEGVTSIGNSAFSWCQYLASIALPKGVKSIGDLAFDNCSSLTSIKLPEGLTYIGDRAFSSCSSLTSITLPKGVKSIGGWAFYNCSSLTSITLPEGTDVVRAYTFADCTSLTSVTIPNSVKQIMTCAFRGCTALTRVGTLASVKQFGLRAFEGCDKLPLVQKLRLKIEGAM